LSVTGHALLTGPAYVKPGGGQPRNPAPADHSLPRRRAICHEAGQKGHRAGFFPGIFRNG